MNFEPILYGPLFSRDAQDVNLVAAGADPIDVTVSVCGSSWTVPVTPALDGGRYLAPLRMREILESVALPLGLQEPGVVDVPAITLSAGDASMSFRTIRGAAAGKTPAQLVGHWLSWRDQISKTYTWGRERLTFLAGLDLLGWRSGTYGVSAKIFLDGSDPVTRTLASGTLQNGCQFITIDASYSAIAALASGRVLAYDLSYSFSGTDSAGVAAAVDGYPLRLVVARPDVRVKEFVFCNGFSVEDRVYSSGRSNPKLEGTAVAFLNGGEESELRNDAEEGKEVYSGYLSSARESALWLDFLKACDRRILLDGIPERIVVDSQETDLQDNALGSVKFAYHLAALDNGRYFNDQEGLGDYDPAQRHGALYIGDEPPSEELPSEDLFFLKTRLDEFPAADLTEELLFLVQNPLTQAWGNASLSNIKAWLQDAIHAYQTPVWSGPWADYAVGVADYALAAALGKDLDDRIRAIEHAPYTLPIATDTVLGGIKVGDGLAITADGTLSAGDRFFEADADVAGGVKLKSAYSGLRAERFYLTDDVCFSAEEINGTVCVRLNAPFITDGDQIILDGEPGGGGGGETAYLNDLLDVAITSPSNGQALVYRNGEWVNGSAIPDLSNYYTKAETYSQAEVDNLIGAINQFHYEIYASTSQVTNPQGNVLYLIGPTGSGLDKYEEYVYSNGWTKIGDTSIDLSGYVQTTNVKTLTLQLNGTTVGSAYNPIGGSDHTINIPKSGITGLLDDTYHPLDGSTTRNTFRIGGATLVWHAASGSTPGYLSLDSPFITAGDQIIEDGTPGGGGGGGIGYLYEALDFSAAIAAKPSARKIMVFDPSATDKNGSAGAWVYADVPAGSITSVALEPGTDNGTVHLVVNGTAQADVAVKGLGSAAYQNTTAFAAASHSHTIADVSGLQTALDGKQATISDLSTIRSNASNGNTAYNSLTTVSAALQSLQAQVDAVATRDCFDELVATAAFVDILSVDRAYASRYYLTDDVYFIIEKINGIACVRLNAPFITDGDQAILDGTPGGGGGGGSAGYLYELGDVYTDANHTKVLRPTGGDRAAGDVLSFDASHGWVALPQASLGVAITQVSGLRSELDALGTSFTTVSAALQSLQAQLDSVATRDGFDELTASAAFIDVLAAGTVITEDAEVGGHSLKAIPNSYLANSTFSVNGASASLGGNVNTANITAGTAGTSSATSGASLAVPYVTVNKYGIVTGYGTHTHSISQANLFGTSAIGSASLPVFYNGSALTACTASSVFSAMSSGAATNLSVTVAGQTRTVTLYATYDSASENISDKFGVVDAALRSLQSQIDSVASRFEWGESGALEADEYMIVEAFQSLQAQLDSLATRVDDQSASGYFDTLAVGSYIYADYLFTTNDQAIASDERRKTNLRPITLTAEQVASCRAVAFDWKDRPGGSFGTIAQDWQKILPESVHDHAGSLTHSYAQAAQVAVINMAREIVALKSEIATLKHQMKMN